MIDKLLDFYNKKNTIDSLAFNSPNYFINKALLLTLANAVLNATIYILARVMCYLEHGTSLALALVCFFSLFALTLYFLGKKIKAAKDEFINKTSNFLGCKCDTFEEYRIYNFLYKIGTDPYFSDDESFFKDLQEKCNYTIASFNHISSLSPIAIVLYTGILSFLTTCFSIIFSELIIKDAGLAFDIIISIAFIFIIGFAINNATQTFELNIRSQISKYKNLQVYLKNAEMLHKKLTKLHGKNYLSKSIMSKKDKYNDLETINAFFNDNNFSNEEMENIKIYINNLIIANENK